MLKKETERIKKEAKKMGVHPMKYFLQGKGVETEADYYRLNPYANDANYFMEDLYGVFESEERPHEYRIKLTDGMGYERQWGWNLFHLCYTKDEAIEYLKKTIERKVIIVMSDGFEVWNY